MKNALSLILALLIFLSLLTACATTEEDVADPAGSAVNAEEIAASYKTLGDVLSDSVAEYREAGWFNGQYSYVFERDNVFFRATAPMSEELSNEVWSIDIMAEDHDEQLAALISPLEITKCENLSLFILSDDEMHALVGKTGAELLESGWTISGWNLDTSEFYLEYKCFLYDVTFDASLDGIPNDDDFDPIATIEPLTVKSVTFNDFGSASELDEAAG